MANNYKTPGVYIEEISKLPPSVAQVETAIPVFIGYTQKAEDPLGDLKLKPKRITSLLEYETYFGTTESQSGIKVTVTETTDGTPAKNVLERTVNGKVDAPAKHNMYYAMQAFFANGGGPCYIVSAGLMKDAAGAIAESELEKGIDAIEPVDEVTLFVFPELQSLEIADVGTLLSKALNQCGKLQDRFVVADILPPGVGKTILDAAATFRDDASLPLDNLKYGAVYTPNVRTTLNYVYKEDEVDVSRVVDGTSTDKKMSDYNPATGSIKDTIIYNLCKSAIDKILLELPAAPLVVGQYASVDSTRGVWKAPANVALATVAEPVIKITHEQQMDLNVSTTGKSINAIRSFAGRGTIIWGARTLAGNDNEWRYVPVRRFFNMAEESIKKASEQFVFEPNDANTWVKVRAMIENFLLLQWRAGALAGAVPEDAFYVKVGLGQTMTALDILEGRMNVEVGLAVVRPAEFIILKFSHKMQTS